MGKKIRHHWVSKYSYNSTLYLWGFEQKWLPRAFRRMIAKTSWHRAWLTGSMGAHYDFYNGYQGVLDRGWFVNRKTYKKSINHLHKN